MGVLFFLDPPVALGWDFGKFSSEGSEVRPRYLVQKCHPFAHKVVVGQGADQREEASGCTNQQENFVFFLASLSGPYVKFELFIPWWLENRGN